MLSVDYLDRGCDFDALSCFYQSFEFQEHPKTAQLISQILYKKEQYTAAIRFLEKAYSTGNLKAKPLLQKGKSFVSKIAIIKIAIFIKTKLAKLVILFIILRKV